MRDRTADLLRARQALSQLSYSPIACFAARRRGRPFYANRILKQLFFADFNVFLELLVRP